MPADEVWRQAIADIRGRYPEDIFPSDSSSIDARSGTFARLLCDQIVRLAEAIEVSVYEPEEQNPDAQ